MENGTRIAITGKGGVGKTTLAATLARLYVDAGYRVIAVDADPDANLGSALGLSAEKAADITPISHLSDVIAERTGAEPGTMGGFFSLNPKVDDIPEKYWVEIAGVRLMVMGTVESGGSGCVCPESAFVRRLTQHLILDRNEVVILDMEAGIEHMGRATASAVDMFIIVLEPGRRSAQTARTIMKLAGEIGVKHVAGVINKVTSDEEVEILRGLLPELPILGTIGAFDSVRQADLQGLPPWETSPEYMAGATAIWQKLNSESKP